MDLLDWFAGQALVALGDSIRLEDWANVARRCYNLAQAMVDEKRSRG